MVMKKLFTTDVNNPKPCKFAMSMKYGYGDDKTFITLKMIVLMNSVNYSKLTRNNNKF